ncbi:hypothetical protein [Streptomyces sp. NPDC005374]|uniref:hypothetical protein n=1 Tax=Streptomyces sp. NPDC005374 TaxID=3364713 RepID=UPI0036B21F3B
MTSSVPWQQRLSTGTEDIQDEVIRWYQQTRNGKAYVPSSAAGPGVSAFRALTVGRAVSNCA